MNHIIFDIETGALPDNELYELFTRPEPDPHPGEFAESSVKLGNLKDEAKIAAKVEAARIAHLEACENYGRDQQAKVDAAWRDFKAKAALSPLTGEVVAIGYMSAKGVAISGQGMIHHDNEEELTEADILAAFWSRYIDCQRSSRQLIGWNIYGFDLAFLVQRSWRLGVDVPSSAFSCKGKWFNWDEKVFFDLMLLFGCGGKFISLDAAAKHFGLPGKNGDGAEFARLWRGTEEEREQARAYLVNDLEMPWVAAQRMGVV